MKKCWIEWKCEFVDEWVMLFLVMLFVAISWLNFSGLFCFFFSNFFLFFLWWLLRNFIIDFYVQLSRRKVHMLHNTPVQTSCLPKFLFSRYSPKLSQSIRLQDSLVGISFWTKWWIIMFCMQSSILGQEK